MQKRLRRPNLLKIYAWVAGALLLLIASEAPSASFVVAVGLLGFGLLVRRWDREWRCCQLLYEFEDAEIGVRMAMASQAGQALASASTIWHVHHAIETKDLKRNAGANTLIQRTPTRVAPGTLSGIELNIEPWAVPVGPQQLLFLPDRLLVWDGRALAGIPYEHLMAEPSTLRFIEDEQVPRDTRVIDMTWQYVNKKGGPDRRFSDNHQLPVVEYGELLLSTATGLRVFLQTSTPAAAAHAAAYLVALCERARAPAGSTGVQGSVAVRYAPKGQPSKAKPSALEQQPAIIPTIESAVMVVMRNLAGADRRVDDTEISLAHAVHQQLGGAHEDLAAFARWFRGLSANDEVTATALCSLARAGPDMKLWIIEQLEKLSLADGRQTKKELERLAEFRAALS